MTILEAIILGVVQGLTEFLPISSTAHLFIVPSLLGWSRDPGAAFSAVIQIGTLAAVVIYFRRDIWTIGRAWLAESLRGRVAQTHEGQLGWMMILGTAPIVAAGLVFKKQIEADFRRLTVIAGSLIFFGLWLFAAERYHAWLERRGARLKELESTTWADALWVGLAQALAIVPGASRSGTTITASLLRGMERPAAARFSFLLSLPAVFLAGAKELYDERTVLLASGGDAAALIAATLVSAIVGYASIAFLLRFLRTHATHVFVAYRVALGVALLALVARGVLPDRPTPSSEANGWDNVSTTAPADGAK